jgi:transcriptional regulator with XRE-family HTH domain
MKLPRLKEWRESRGLMQKEVAEDAGVSVYTVLRAEGGISIRPNTARKIAEALNVTVADLLEDPPVPLGQAPTSSGPAEEVEGSEERREDLRKIQEAFLETHNLFEELAGTYRASGDEERLEALRSAAALSSLGAAQLVEEDVDIDRDYELGVEHVVAALNRLDSLSEVLEAEGVGLLAEVKARQRRRNAAS